MVKKKDWGKEKGLRIRREEGLIISKIEGVGKGKDCTIILKYNSGNWKEIEEVLGKQIKEKREESVIILYKRAVQKRRER